MEKIRNGRIENGGYAVSLVSVAQVSPSRISGIYQYLLQSENYCAAKKKLQSAFAPESLRSRITGEDEEGQGSSMISEPMREGVKLGLFEDGENADGDYIRISSNLLMKPQSELSDLPAIIASLVFENAENENLALAIAWYLSQNPLAAPGTQTEVTELLRTEIADGRYGITSDVRYGQFEDWVCYLGFAWCHSLNGRRVMVPDPKVAVERSLHKLYSLRTGETISIRQMVKDLSTELPVLEEGKIRNLVEDTLKNIGKIRQQDYFSISTSLALLKLENLGCIKLLKQSDAGLYILNNGDKTIAKSDIVWNGKSEVVASS